MTYLEETVNKSIEFLDQLYKEIEYMRQNNEVSYSWQNDYYKKKNSRNQFKPLKLKLEETIEELKCAINDPLRNHPLQNQQKNLEQ